VLVVVDANTIFSALLSKGRTFEVFVSNSLLRRVDFIAPEFLFLEIGKHFDEILERSKLSSEELPRVFGFIKEEIEFVPFDEFIRYATEAETLAPHAKDIQYFALALAYDAAIWSNEKAFKDQSEVKIYSTAELLALIS
jgi:predicted nucleic acid-binding protein